MNLKQYAGVVIFPVVVLIIILIIGELIDKIFANDDNETCIVNVYYEVIIETVLIFISVYFMQIISQKYIHTDYILGDQDLFHSHLSNLSWAIIFLVTQDKYIKKINLLIDHIKEYFTLRR